jgi:hypothetical protein
MGPDFYPRRVRFGTYPPGFLLEVAGLIVLFDRQYYIITSDTLPPANLYIPFSSVQYNIWIVKGARYPRHLTRTTLLLYICLAACLAMLCNV